MKRTFSFLCLASLIISMLCACGMSDVKKAEAAIDAIGEVDLNSENAIKAAKELFLELDETQREKVSNRDKLENAENTFYDLQIVNVEDLIDRIAADPDLSQEAIDAARTAFDALDGEMREKVKNADKLAQAEEKYEILQHISDYKISNYRNIGTGKVSPFNRTADGWYRDNDAAATVYICFLLQGDRDNTIDLGQISFNVCICICKEDDRIDVYSEYGEDCILGIQYWPSSDKAQFGTIKTKLAPKEYADILVTAGIVDAEKEIPISSVTKILNIMG